METSIKKKVLYIYTDKIYGHDGGSVGARRYFLNLKSLEEQGKIILLSISLDNFPNQYGIKIEKHRFLDVLARCLFKSNFLFFYLIKYKKNLSEFNPDVVLLPSRLGFFAKAFVRKHKRTKCVVYFDNIEFDYCVNAVPFFAKPLERLIVHHDEKLSVCYGDKLIFLTQRDEKRCQILYPLSSSRNRMIFPITVKESAPLCRDSGKPTIFLLGNFSYRPNLESAFWFCGNVLSLLNLNDLDLVFAGSNFSPSLKKLCEEKNIQYFENFENLADFLPRKSCLIAPILSGAGMKTKIAESLSLGLFVIGTDEAFAGYDLAFSSKPKHILLANTPLDFSIAISNYTHCFFSDKDFHDNVEIYEKYYNTDSYKDFLFSFLFS